MIQITFKKWRDRNYLEGEQLSAEEYIPALCCSSTREIEVFLDQILPPMKQYQEAIMRRYRRKIHDPYVYTLINIYHELAHLVMGHNNRIWWFEDGEDERHADNIALFLERYDE
ncbi:MAG: hypothetical protein N2V78_09150 [Methanophagales archaeon]|nr:hypothetical protein [Methanophagales archaeon]